MERKHVRLTKGGFDRSFTSMKGNAGRTHTSCKNLEKNCETGKISSMLTLPTMRIGDFDPLDRKFWSKTPEPGFSVARNRWIINNTIKKYEENRAKKMTEFTDKLRERTDAAATYLSGMQGAHRSRSIEGYFGKTYLAHLRGQDIQNMLVRQQEMLVKDKEERHKQKQVQKELQKVATKGTTYKIKHYAEKKPELKAGF